MELGVESLEGRRTDLLLRFWLHAQLHCGPERLVHAASLNELPSHSRGAVGLGPNRIVSVKEWQKLGLNREWWVERVAQIRRMQGEKQKTATGEAVALFDTQRKQGLAQLLAKANELSLSISQYAVLMRLKAKHCGLHELWFRSGA